MPTVPLPGTLAIAAPLPHPCPAVYPGINKPVAVADWLAHTDVAGEHRSARVPQAAAQWILQPAALLTSGAPTHLDPSADTHLCSVFRPV